jgi:hypothetical protein
MTLLSSARRRHESPRLTGTEGLGDHSGVTKDATVRIARKMLWWQVGSGRSAQW